MARYQVLVSFKNGIFDPAGATAYKQLKGNYIGLTNIATGKSLIVEGDLSLEDVKEMCESVLTNPVLEDYEISELRG